MDVIGWAAVVVDGLWGRYIRHINLLTHRNFGARQSSRTPGFTGAGLIGDCLALAIIGKRLTLRPSLDTFFTSMTWKSSGEPCLLKI
jgi:hypothetical protein